MRFDGKKFNFLEKKFVVHIQLIPNKLYGEIFGYQMIVVKYHNNVDFKLCKEKQSEL